MAVKGAVLIFLILDFVTRTYSASYHTRVPLIILGVDGYGYNEYNEYSNTGSDTVLPLMSVFPAFSFPNFYSISTGLYPTQHGIISNIFLNKHRNATFFFLNNQHDNFDWYKGEPIWITAKKAGLRVYTDMWIGAAASYSGLQPDFVTLYNHNKTLYEKTEDLIANMDGTTWCDLYMIFCDQPDSLLHRTDMRNKSAVQAIFTSVEQQISHLKSSLGNRKYNLVILSDHGMTSFKHNYKLSQEVVDRARFFFGGPVGMWYTKEGDDVGSTVKELNDYIAKHNMKGVRAKDVRSLPKRYELCGLEDEGRPDIVLMLENGVTVNQFPKYFKSGHGYDNTLPQMYGHVRVSGPGFKKKIPSPVTTDTVIINTELYNLFSSLLGIVPADNTGTLKTFDFLLKDPPNRDEWEGTYQQMPTPCTSWGTSASRGTRVFATSTASLVFTFIAYTYR